MERHVGSDDRLRSCEGSGVFLLDMDDRQSGRGGE